MAAEPSDTSVEPLASDEVYYQVRGDYLFNDTLTFDIPFEYFCDFSCLDYPDFEFYGFRLYLENDESVLWYYVEEAQGPMPIYAYRNGVWTEGTQLISFPTVTSIPSLLYNLLMTDATPVGNNLGNYVSFSGSYYFLDTGLGDLWIEDGWNFDVSVPGGFYVGSDSNTYNRLVLHNDSQGNYILDAYTSSGSLVTVYSSDQSMWFDPYFKAITFLQPLSVVENSVFDFFFTSNYTQSSYAAFDIGTELGNLNGYENGYSAGEDYGYSQGELEGYQNGYEVGHTEGYNAGVSSNIGENFLGDLMSNVARGLSNVVLLEYTTPFGLTTVITIWSVFGTLIVIMIVIWYLKLFAGG